MAIAGRLPHGVFHLLLACGCGVAGGTRAAEPADKAQAGPASKVMHLEPRYARINTDPGVEEAEANYQYKELQWDLPLRDAAVVCVDCWNWHFSRETLERTEDCTAKNIAPLLAACSATRTTMGLPAICSRGFPGKRVEACRAGMTTLNATIRVFRLPRRSVCAPRRPASPGYHRQF